MKENAANNPLTENELKRALSALPREVTPERDAWDQVRGRILGESSESRPAMWKAQNSWLGVAASLVLVAIASLLFMQSSEVTPPVSPATQPVATTNPESPYEGGIASTWSVELEYQAAFKEFLGMDAYRQLPAGAAGEGIVTGWQEMQQLDAELRAALKQDPDNPLLKHRLMQLRSKQLHLLHVIADSGPMPGRNLI